MVLPVLVFKLLHVCVFLNHLIKFNIPCLIITRAYIEKFQQHRSYKVLKENKNNQIAVKV